MYGRVRAGEGETAWNEWRRERDELFAAHPPSALEPAERAGFTGLAYYPYDWAWRVTGRVTPAPQAPAPLGHSGPGETPFRRVAAVDFEVGGHAGTLPLHWLESYGGGIFLPFRDATTGTGTYGGGRYLLDTAKGADLGHESDLIVLDFNYAYQPSCSYSARWSCPLPPPDATLGFAVQAGERTPGSPPVGP